MVEVPRRPAVLISYPLPDAAVQAARARVEVDLHTETSPIDPIDLVARLKGRQGLICLITDVVDEGLLAACPDLRVVANVAVGFNNIDVEAATRRGVVVTNTPDVLTDTTADFAWALLMAAARRVPEGDRYVRAGNWRRWDFRLLLGADVHHKTLGIVGFGRIGRGMARRAAGFEMRVLYQDAMAADPATERELRATRVDLPTLLRESDFVTLHTPLLAETRHLISAETLKHMKKTALLINASRGAVVDEAALVRALKDGWIAGAGLDVFEHEPEVHPELIGLDNVVLAPHIASASHDTRFQMAMLAVDNCLAVLEGRTPPSPVNPEVLTARTRSSKGASTAPFEPPPPEK
jgi:glyoxylate reductase